MAATRFPYTNNNNNYYNGDGDCSTTPPPCPSHSRRRYVQSFHQPSLQNKENFCKPVSCATFFQSKKVMFFQPKAVVFAPKPKRIKSTVLTYLWFTGAFVSPHLFWRPQIPTQSLKPEPANGGTVSCANNLLISKRTGLCTNEE